MVDETLIANASSCLFFKSLITLMFNSRTGELCNRLSSDTQVLQNAVTVSQHSTFRSCSIHVYVYANSFTCKSVLALFHLQHISNRQLRKHNGTNEEMFYEWCDTYWIVFKRLWQILTFAAMSASDNTLKWNCNVGKGLITWSTRVSNNHRECAKFQANC